MDNPQFSITVYRGLDGGRVIYESIDGESRLVIGGNQEEAVKWFAAKMAKLDETGPELPESERLIYAPPARPAVRDLNPVALRETLKTNIIQG